MTVIVHHRTSCRLCDSENIKVVVKLEPIPLSENYTCDNEVDEKDVRYPVDVSMCLSCGHVQQMDVVDSKSLWRKYTYFSGQAMGMPEHFSQVASKVMVTQELKTRSLVIDIGSNDGSLLKPFRDAGHRVLGIDPAIEVAKQATASGIETIPELISIPLAQQVREKYGAAQVVCMFNAFAHVDNMGAVAQSIRMMLAPDGIFVFEAQYLMDVIDRVLIATIFHEHISHHSVKPLIRFFDRHNLELIDVERVAIQHGSIIGVVQLKDGGRKVNDSVRQIVELETSRELDKVQTLNVFANRVGQLRASTEALVKLWRQTNAVVAGFGAARSGPTLIAQLGLHGVIEYIFDDHPQKVGKYSSGDGIAIIPTKELCTRMPDYTVILAWVHVARIIETNQEYLAKGGRFVVLCPETRVVDKTGTVDLASRATT